MLPLRRIPTKQGTPRWTSQPWFLSVGTHFSHPRRFADGLPAAARISPVDQAGRRSVIPSIPIRLRSATCFPQGLRASPTFSLLHHVTDDPHPEAERGKPPEKGESPQWVSRPALCMQPRDGKLFVFMPPVEYLADYLDLVAAIEDTAAHLNMPVMLEGYAPASRSANPSAQSDAGSGRDRSEHSSGRNPGTNSCEPPRRFTTLARETRLGTEKFMLDGQHSGTGGGNHIVIGGPTPADSAFLRRPDLLRSLVGYWHNHPSLSYLFSGMFIGPTSQHPRVDEARTDSIYELEIAFNQIPGRRVLPTSRRGWSTASSVTC